MKFNELQEKGGAGAPNDQAQLRAPNPATSTENATGALAAAPCSARFRWGWPSDLNEIEAMNMPWTVWERIKAAALVLAGKCMVIGVGRQQSLEMLKSCEVPFAFRQPRHTTMFRSWTPPDTQT